MNFPELKYPHLSIHPYSRESLGSAIAGISGLTWHGNLSAAWPLANLAIFIPFLIFSKITVLKMYWINGSAPVSGNVDVGIYDHNGKRRVSSGSTAKSGGANALQVVDIADTNLEPGFFYLAMACDSTNNIERWTVVNAEACRSLGILQQQTAFPLPDPAVFAAMAQNYIPVVGLATHLNP